MQISVRNCYHCYLGGALGMMSLSTFFIKIITKGSDDYQKDTFLPMRVQISWLDFETLLVSF